MAAKHLTVLSSLDFPQLYTSPIVEEVDRVLAKYQPLENCSYESVESRAGACDGGEPCGDPAREIVDGQAFCLKHACKARLDAALAALEVNTEVRQWEEFLETLCTNCGGAEGRADGFCDECKPLGDAEMSRG